jgi:hypothetical protein
MYRILTFFVGFLGRDCVLLAYGGVMGLIPLLIIGGGGLITELCGRADIWLSAPLII